MTHNTLLNPPHRSGLPVPFLLVTKESHCGFHCTSYLSASSPFPTPFLLRPCKVHFPYRIRFNYRRSLRDSYIGLSVVSVQSVGFFMPEIRNLQSLSCNPKILDLNVLVCHKIFKEKPLSNFLSYEYPL